jgi:hypothetical protein
MIRDYEKNNTVTSTNMIWTAPISSWIYLINDVPKHTNPETFSNTVVLGNSDSRVIRTILGQL